MLINIETDKIPFAFTSRFAHKRKKTGAATESKQCKGRYTGRHSDQVGYDLTCVYSSKSPGPAVRHILK